MGRRAIAPAFTSNFPTPMKQPETRARLSRALVALLVLTAVHRLCAGEPFVPGKERDWEFLNQGKFRGTLVKVENGKAFIRMADGVVREFWPGQGDGIAGSYFQRLMAKIPANPTKREPMPGNGPVVDLSADALPAGSLLQWKNSGRLGVAFQTMNQAPKVTQVGGRKAVVFEHAPWLLPMEYQTMVSDFYLPESVIGARALTVVAWVYILAEDRGADHRRRDRRPRLQSRRAERRWEKVKLWHRSARRCSSPLRA